MRTSYNKDLKSKETFPKEEVAEIEEGVNKDDTNLEVDEDDNSEASIEGILKAIEDNYTPIECDDLEYDFIFTTSVEEANSVDFPKLFKEIDEALYSAKKKEEDSINYNKIGESIEDSLKSFISYSDEEGNQDVDLFEDTEDVLENDGETNVSPVGDIMGNEKVETESENTESSDIGISNSLKPSKTLIKGVVIAVIVVGGIVVGCNIVNNRNSVSGLEKDINNLYTSVRKDDIKGSVTESKLGKYYSKAEELGVSKTKDIIDELDCISLYLADKGIIDNMNSSSSYDLNSSDRQSNIEKVKYSYKNYKVRGLADSIEKGISRLNSDYEYYIGLRDDLSTVNDYSGFDVKGYQIKINDVTHTINKQELQGMLDSIAKSLKLEETIQDLKDTSSAKIDEATGSFMDKLDAITNSIKDLIPNIIEGIKHLFLGNKS